MEASREVFWNIQFGDIIYILAVIVVSIFIYSAYRRYKLWRMGRRQDLSGHIGRRIWSFVITGVVDGIFHRKFFGALNVRGRRHLSASELLPSELFPGISHFLIFGGCIILILGSFLDSISHYFFDFMHGGFYLGYSLVTDIAGIMVILGVILFLVRRYSMKPERLDNKTEDLVALLLITLVVATGFVVESLRIAATEIQTNPEWAPWSPLSFGMALAFRGLAQETLLNWHRISWWAHSLISLGAIAYVSLYWNRLWHILISPLNVFFRNLGVMGTVSREDYAAGQSFGVTRIEDFTWKELLDLDACTRCGRCQDACPAYSSSKPLNPKKVILNLKDSWLESGHKAEVSNTPSDVVTEEVIWECTTCGACMEVCPVFIEHVPKIIGMRRDLVEMRAKFPDELLNFFESMEQRNNPWGIAPAERVKWTAGTNVQPFEAGKTDYLLFVGCSGAFDARNRHVTLATSKILDAAGVSWGILGKDEPCCGDSLRRLGNEYVFDRMAKNNVKMFMDRGINKVITQCPHCYHTLKNDYRQYGIELEVIHHTELINDLLKGGNLKINQTPDMGNVVFHDSCYLGRYNGIYEAPRKAIALTTGQAPSEMKRHRNRSFCCGGGGGRMWMEENIGSRINALRVEEAIGENPKTICVCCPYCMTMFEDGLKDKGANDKVQVLDLAEVVARAIK